MVKCYFYKNKKILETNNWEIVKELLSDKNNIVYINIFNPSKTDFNMLQNLLSIHPLTIEDCCSSHENPKIEDFETYIFSVVHNIYYVEEEDELLSLPLNIILTENCVVTVYKEKTGTFDEILVRIASEAEDVYKDSSNIYYTIIDTLIDNYFPLLTFWSNKLDTLEEDILEDSKSEIIERIMYVRKNLLKLKKIFTGQREVIYKISHNHIKFITKENKIYLKDVFDHIVKLCSTLEEYRDWASSLMDAHFSYSSSKLNENMQRLTSISIIFMPLTFIVGLYGMNFEHMPELKWRYGYFWVLFIMLAIALGLITYFKRKKMF